MRRAGGEGFVSSIKRVLLIDDDAEFRRLYVALLERRGYRVVQAKTGASATALLTSGRPFDLLIVDGVLPDTTGVSWLERARTAGVRTPAVYVTAFPQDLRTIEELRTELDVVQVLYKPVIPTVFLALVDHVLAPEPPSGATLDPGRDSTIDSTPRAPNSAPRHSDPDPEIERVMAEAREEYRASLPTRLTELASAVEAARLDPLDHAAFTDARMRAHKLRGTAGVYGADRVGDAAARIEEALMRTLSHDLALRKTAWADAERIAADLPSLAEEPTLTRGAPMAAARILVVDEDEETRKHLTTLGRQSFIGVVGASTAEDALAIARAQTTPFDVALVDMTLGDGEVAFRLARDLRALPGYERLPLAFISQDGTFEHRVAAAHAGGSLYLSKPIDAYVFGTTVQHLLALRHQERTRVLVVDDDEDFALSVAEVLQMEGIAVTRLTDPSRVLDVMDEENPDLILLDVMLPGVSGFDVARMIRTTPHWADVPILFLTGRTDLESRVAAFGAGGDDYLGKPIVPEELLARVRVRLDRRRLLREMTEKDSLTKLLSRRALLEGLTSRFSEARRHGRLLSIAMLDVDKFKRVNDTHGHAVGDQVLASLGRLLGERFRLEDLRGRWGGEEFLVVFPGESAETVAGVLRRVLAEFRKIPFRGQGGETFHSTFSGGIASFPDDGASVDVLLKRSDERLYAAKAAGRNRVFGPALASETRDSREPRDSSSSAVGAAGTGAAGAAGAAGARENDTARDGFPFTRH